MFKKSKNKQLEMFKDVLPHLSSIAQKKIEDKSAWNVVFYNDFTSKVNEELYSILYSEKMGRPNAEVRVLLGMMLVKELQGWSDEQLFDECMFNLRVRLALGLRNLDAQAPSSSTYYDFRSKLAYHKSQTGEDLIEQTFGQICELQIMNLGISGSKIRMDSKLIQSNIAQQNRLQLVVEALRVIVVKKGLEHLEVRFNKRQYDLLDKLQKRSTSNLTYQLTKDDRDVLFIEIGQIIHTLIEIGYVPKGGVLYQLFGQQYKYGSPSEDENDNSDKLLGIIGTGKEEIETDSIQSIHDIDAAYRKKKSGDSVQIVKGYHTNITETCGQKDKPNLITDVITAPANISECEFLIPAIDNTNKILASVNKVNQVITDGGYDSNENRRIMQLDERPEFKLQKLKGSTRVYNMKFTDENELEVIDMKTGELLKVTHLVKKDTFRITKANGKFVYFKQEQVSNYILGLRLQQSKTVEDYNLRASVESTIHEVFHRLCRRKKTRYRGLIKSHWYVLMRAMAVNIGRIGRYINEKQQYYLLFTQWGAKLYVVISSNKSISLYRI